MYKVIIGLFVLIALALAGVFWGLWEQNKFANEAAQNETRYFGETYSVAVNKCQQARPLAHAECVAQAANAAREFQRGERDLVAQRVTAVWTALMGAAAMIGILLSVVAAYYVWKTFEATRQANDIAREIGEAQVRAYPSVASINISGITNGLPAFCVNVSNSGNSPALRMNCHGRLILTYQTNLAPNDTFPEGAVRQTGMEISVESESQVPIPPSVGGVITVFVPHFDDAGRNETMRAMSANVLRKNPFWIINFSFEWHDVFGKKYCFYINASQRPNPISRQIVGEISAMDELVLRYPLEISYRSESSPVEV